jgi:AraC-like DNA-binding protein
MRMQYALQLLSSNSMQIKNIEEECGYRSTSFFIKEFKKYFNETPRNYRISKTDFDNRDVSLLNGWSRLPKPRKSRRKSSRK